MSPPSLWWKPTSQTGGPEEGVTRDSPPGHGTCRGPGHPKWLERQGAQQEEAADASHPTTFQPGQEPAPLR